MPFTKFLYLWLRVPEPVPGQPWEEVVLDMKVETAMEPIHPFGAFDIEVDRGLVPEPTESRCNIYAFEWFGVVRNTELNVEHTLPDRCDTVKDCSVVPGWKKGEKCGDPSPVHSACDPLVAAPQHESLGQMRPKQASVGKHGQRRQIAGRCEPRFLKC